MFKRMQLSKALKIKDIACPAFNRDSMKGYTLGLKERLASLIYKANCFINRENRLVKLIQILLPVASNRINVSSYSFIV